MGDLLELEIHDPLESKFVGALLGCGIGDALGQPFEGRTRKTIETICGGDSSKFFRGRYTDDTQLTLAMAEGLIRGKGYKPEVMVERFIEWLDEPPIGPGMACLNSIYGLSQGVPWTQSGYDSGANGSAMRISPVGLFFRNDIPTMIRITDETTKMTHTQEPATAAAIVVTRAVSYLTFHEEIDSEDFLDVVSKALQKPEHDEFKDHLLSLSSYLKKPHKEALKEIGILGVRPQYLPRNLHKEGIIHPYACSTVLGALYCFLLTPNDYYGSVNEAVLSGGDTDTSSAICGAISGAFNGIHALPKSLMYRLIDHERIFKIGRELFQVYSETNPSS